MGVEYLKCSKVVDKQLKAMERSGKKGEWAAAQCETIIETIKNKGVLAGEVYNKRTKNGESRISNCVKYNLGNGFRLVTVRRGNYLFIPFVGTHDETDQWIDRHKRSEFEVDDPSYCREDYVKTEPGYPGEGERDPKLIAEQNDPYEQKLLEKVDESILREVFRGLCGRKVKI